jgi:8-oxo-dGTP diphosphatase
VLVGKRVSGGAIGGLWEFPGGKVRKGESAPDALVREFREELNVEVAVGPYLGSVEFVHKATRYEVLVYAVSLATEGLRKHMHSRLEWYTLSEIAGLELADSDREILSLISERAE